MNHTNCPICGNPNAISFGLHGQTPSDQAYFYRCQKCGDFGLAFDFWQHGDQPDSADGLFKVGCLLAERKEHGLLQIVLLKNGPARGVGSCEGIGINEFLEGFPRMPLEYFDRTLLNLAHIVKPPVGTFVISPNLYPLCFAQDFSEAFGILNELTDQELLRWIDPINKSALLITAKGWERIAKLQAPGRDSHQAFVAMWFEPSRQSIFDEGFKPAIEDDGKTKAVRIDRKEHNQKIDDEIVAEIRRSRYLVADFTGNRGGVYFEAGFALGLGLPVIWCIEQGHEKDLHFDTRQFNHIVYANAAELRTRLSNRIRATIF